MDRQEVEQAVSRIMSMRLNILPAYCYDEDEGERDSVEYLAFYRNNAQQSMEAARTYAEALKRFYEEHYSESSFHNLIAGRKQFIAFFPFCDDELQGIASGEMEQYVVELEKIYRSICMTHTLPPLLNRLLEYEQLCQKIEKHGSANSGG